MCGYQVRVIVHKCPIYRCPYASSAGLVFLMPLDASNFFSLILISFKYKEFAHRKLTFKQFSSVFDAVEAKPKMITLGEMPKDFVLSAADIKALHKYVHQGGSLLANLKKDSPEHGSADSLLTRFIPGGK